MTSNGITLDILQRIHYLPLEKQDFDIKEFLIGADLIQKVKQKDKETLSILCKPDLLRQIVGILSNKPSMVEDKDEHFRLIQIISELFTMKDNKELLNSFLGENPFKNSDNFICTDFRLTTEQFGSETKLDNSEIEESNKQEKFICPNSPMRTSINCQPNQESPILSQNQFYYSDNVFIDFLDILKVQGIDEPCVQYYFNQILTSFLSYKPETMNSSRNILDYKLMNHSIKQPTHFYLSSRYFQYFQCLFNHKMAYSQAKKHDNEYLLNYAYKYIGDFDIADIVEKVCFQLYQPSENISISYINKRENQIVKIINELLDMITPDIDEFDLKSLCRIFKNCISKCTSHQYFQNFIKFSNLIFTPQRVQNYINILVKSQRSLIVCEIVNLLISGLQLIQQSPKDAEPNICNQSQFQDNQFNKEWLKIVVDNLRRIKESRLDFVDRKKTIMTQFEQTIQMFGNDKLCIIDFVFELIKLNDYYLVNEILMHDYPQTIFSYLYEYDWNNLVHEKVYFMISYLVNDVIELQKKKTMDRNFQINNENSYFLLIHIFKKIRKSSSDDTVTLEVKKIQIKRPNIAFIIKIAECLERLRNNFPQINEITFENNNQRTNFINDQIYVLIEKWVDFCQTFLKKNLDIQKINLGEYDKSKDQENNFNEERVVKQSKNSSKLSERFRKNSGKDMSLFILNPSNKKFSTSSKDTSQKFEKNYDKEQDSNAQTPYSSSQSAKFQRKKMMLDEDNEGDDLLQCCQRKKVSISVERKSGSSIQQGNQNYSLNVNSFNNNSEKENDVKHMQQNEAQSSQAITFKKSNDILENLDDSWETSTKRIITLGSRNQGGISYDESQIQKNKINNQTCISENQIPQSEKNERIQDFIMLKKKLENNQTQISSFGEKLMENLNIKKKKFSYDEQNSSQFLLSPRIFQKKKRVKSQPNLHNVSLFDVSDQLKEELENLANFKEQCNQGQSFTNVFAQDIDFNNTEKEKFSTIKIQPSCSIEQKMDESEQSPIKSPINLQSCAGLSPSKKQNRSLQLKQSNSLKESYYDDEKKNESDTDDSFRQQLIENKNTLKISLSQISNKKFKQNSTRQCRSISNQKENSIHIQKINEEENDSQSETEMSNSKSSNSNSKSDSSSDLQQKEKEIPQSQKTNNPEHLEIEIQDSSSGFKSDDSEGQQENNDFYWLLGKPKTNSQSLFKDFETRDSSTSCYITEKKLNKFGEESPNKTSISDFFNNRIKVLEPKFDEQSNQKVEDITPVVNQSRRRKESIFENSEFLSPICQIINKDDTESCINNYDYDGSEQSTSILSQRLSMNRSINQYSSQDKNYIQESSEYSLSVQNKQVKQNPQKEYDSKDQQSFNQNDTTFSTTLENDKLKQIIDNSLYQESSFIL